MYVKRDFLLLGRVAASVFISNGISHEQIQPEFGSDIAFNDLCHSRNDGKLEVKHVRLIHLGFDHLLQSQHCKDSFGYAVHTLQNRLVGGFLNIWNTY